MNFINFQDMPRLVQQNPLYAPTVKCDAYKYHLVLPVLLVLAEQQNFFQPQLHLRSHLGLCSGALAAPFHLLRSFFPYGSLTPFGTTVTIDQSTASNCRPNYTRALRAGEVQLSPNFTRATPTMSVGQDTTWLAIKLTILPPDQQVPE